MLIALIVAVGLMATSVLLHYQALRITSDFIPRMVFRPQTRLLFVLAATMLTHVCAITMFALAYFAMTRVGGLGAMHGDFKGEPLDFFYFSTTTYTTLGIGDVYALGPLRIVAALESLTGLMMIAWSATFSYLHMERFWEMHRK